MAKDIHGSIHPLTPTDLGPLLFFLPPCCKPKPPGAKSPAAQKLLRNCNQSRPEKLLAHPRPQGVRIPPPKPSLAPRRSSLDTSTVPLLYESASGFFFFISGLPHEPNAAGSLVTPSLILLSRERVAKSLSCGSSFALPLLSALIQPHSLAGQQAGKRIHIHIHIHILHSNPLSTLITSASASAVHVPAV
ncbi:uncharacterized protein Triagg1_1436 [Trichoderma aggressivum f. europaeum]|uniref:Uncharacterized protein n=1 Tax=Trichoderma aggressivum f. europaeum TaxID=173218 RepID=A0AAE1IKE3_9HYPO|nr:hypothetical protein Triagg1_1436 [Trichoderma aggressivum f. europaeum]